MRILGIPGPGLIILLLAVITISIGAWPQRWSRPAQP